MVDLEVQKQIAEYWREQFMTAMRKHGKDGSEFVEEHGLHPPPELDRLGPGALPLGPLSTRPPAIGSSSSPSPSATPGAHSKFGSNGNAMAVVKDDGSSYPNSTTHSSPAPSSEITTPSGGSYVPHITHRDPKPTISIEDLSTMFSLFSSHILPLIPDYTPSFSPELCLEAWNSTKAERDEIKDHGQLTDMFEHCVIAAHGFRLSAEAEKMHRFAKKSEDLLQLLFFQRESQCQPDLAQKLVQVLILLSFYYAGDDRDGSKQSVIMLAYQIISMHRTFIAPATMHRVYYTMMSLSENQADRVYWFNQASSLATQMKIKSHTSLSAASMMFIFSSLHPKANFDQAPPAFTKPQLQAFLKKIDEARNYFIATQQSLDGMMLTQDAVSTFSVLMNGCRSELLFLLGEFESAQATAQWTIEAGASLPRPVHMSMFGIQCATEVALAMHMMPAAQLALSTFERHAAALPVANRFRRRIMSQINVEQPGDGAVTSPGGSAVVGGISGLLSSSNDMMINPDYMQNGLLNMNEDLGYSMNTINTIGLHPMPSTDPHFGTPADRIPQQHNRPTQPLQPLRMSGSAPNDDMLIMYSDDYPNFS
jgi:hypothetical protein